MKRPIVSPKVRLSFGHRLSALAGCALALVMSASISRAALTDGLVSYWPLDANNAGSASDLSFGNNLLIAGSPTVGSGQFSNAFTLGGAIYLTNVFTYNNNDTGLPIYGAGSYTITMWVKGAAQANRFVYSEGNTTNANPIIILQTGSIAATQSKLDVILRNTRGQNLIVHAVTTNVVFDNTWHHVGWVDDRGNVSVYIDGVLDPASSTFNYVWSKDDLTMNTVSIGSLLRTAIAGTGSTFVGQVDEVATWERPLSQGEVQQVRTNGVYTQGTPVPARPLTLSKVPANTTKKVGEWHVLSVDPGGNRPITYQWSSNGIPLVDGTTRYYRVTNFQTNNTGDFFSCAITNPTGFAITTNATFTVPDDPTPNTTNGLINYWPLDVVNEITNTPELHFTHAIVMRGMDTNTAIQAGQFSNSFVFVAGNSSYGYRTNGTCIYTRTNYTISLWVNGFGTSQADRRIFSEGAYSYPTANDNPLFTLGTDNVPSGFAATASIYPFVRGSTSGNSPITARLSTRPVFDGVWHHVVWTDANGDAKLYVDGVLDETDYKYTRPVLSGLNQTSLGAVLRTGVGNFFTGNLDEVATWNRVLTWTEIQQIRTNGVPIPGEVILPPSITSQPANRTNNIFVGDNVSFNVGINGSPVLYYQWSRNGTPINGGLNPTALTDTLLLSNVQSVDSNTTYSVVISNASGMATSQVARLYVKPFTVVTNGIALNVDIDTTLVNDTQPGFSQFTQTFNPGSIDNGVRLTFTPIGTSLAERHRPNAAGEAFVTNVPPFMTQGSLYNDFVFANSTADGTGVRILIERLGTNMYYGLMVWSFDAVSGGLRFSDWNETSSGSPILITNGYTFDGAIRPTNNYEGTFGGLVTSSAAGTLQLEGLKNGGTSFGVFVNAIRLVANPTGVKINNVSIVGGNIRVTVEGDYPNQPILLHQNTDVIGGSWVDSGATVIARRGPIVVFETPVTSDRMFYRPVTHLP